LLFPAKDACTGAVHLGAGFVAALHVNPREAGMDVDIVGPEFERLFSCFQGLVQAPHGKADFGHRMPRLKAVRLLLDRRLELLDRRLVFPEGEIEGGFFDEMGDSVMHWRRVRLSDWKLRAGLPTRHRASAGKGGLAGKEE